MALLLIVGVGAAAARATKLAERTAVLVFMMSNELELFLLPTLRARLSFLEVNVVSSTRLDG